MASVGRIVSSIGLEIDQCSTISAESPLSIGCPPIPAIPSPNVNMPTLAQILPPLPTSADQFNLLPTIFPTDGPLHKFAQSHTGFMADPLIDTTMPLLPCPPQFGTSTQIPFPQTPPPCDYTPPWASHNPFTIAGTDLPPVLNLSQSGLPLSPPHDSTGGALPTSPVTSGDRHIRNRSKSSGVPLNPGGRHRNWSLTLDTAPGGEVRATGLVADDGMFIPHGM